tara:strand:- start:140 stop:409 length:270 start_codon:yes stop_codon:yes gene_type:complete
MTRTPSPIIAERLLTIVKPEDYTSFNELKYDIATGNITKEFDNGYGFEIIENTEGFESDLKDKWNEEKLKDEPKGIIENVVNIFKRLFR